MTGGFQPVAFSPAFQQESVASCAFQTVVFDLAFQQCQQAQPAEQYSGGWEGWIAYRKRQKYLDDQERKRLARIEQEQKEAAELQKRIELDQQRIAYEKARERSRIHVIREIERQILANQEELERIKSHLESLLVFAYLEMEQSERKRKNIILSLLLGES